MRSIKHLLLGLIIIILLFVYIVTKKQTPPAPVTQSETPTLNAAISKPMPQEPTPEAQPAVPETQSAVVAQAEQQGASEKAATARPASLAIQSITTAQPRAATPKTNKTAPKKATLSKTAITHEKRSRQPSSKAPVAATRSVVINNKIIKDMLGYKYFGTHYPTKFTIAVNGKEIKQGAAETLSVTDNKFTVRYDYEFQNGKRKGAKEIDFNLDPKANSIDLTFTWKDEWRILIDKAMPVAAHPIEIA